MLLQLFLAFGLTSFCHSEMAVFFPGGGGKTIISTQLTY